jgi:hypothetical protein
MLYTRTIHEIQLTCFLKSLWLGVNKFTKSKLVLMVLLIDTRLDLWPKVLLKSTVWIIEDFCSSCSPLFYVCSTSYCSLSTLVTLSNRCQKGLP